MRARTSSPLKPKPLSNLPETKKDSDENEDKEPLDPEVHSTEEHCKNNETPSIDLVQINKSSQRILEFLGPEKRTVTP